MCRPDRARQAAIARRSHILPIHQPPWRFCNPNNGFCAASKQSAKTVIRPSSASSLSLSTMRAMRCLSAAQQAPPSNLRLVAHARGKKLGELRLTGQARPGCFQFVLLWRAVSRPCMSSQVMGSLLGRHLTLPLCVFCCRPAAPQQQAQHCSTVATRAGASNEQHRQAVV